MQTIQYQQPQSLPINRGRMIKQLADSTIRNVVDAIVELVTNSDDNYISSEESGDNTTGKIDVHVVRYGGGRCTNLKVVDEGSGMDYRILQSAIEFGGDTSGFKEGKSVRGFLGRGLKESIIALGKGTIYTLNNGILSSVVIYYDQGRKNAVYELSVPVANLTLEQLKEYGFTNASGTVVNIDINNEDKNNISSRETFIDHLQDHYALRDILSSKKRIVELYYSEPDSKDKYCSITPLKYSYPQGNKIISDKKNIDGYDTYFEIYESPEQLDSPNNSWGNAGLLIKTEGAILDNQLFGYETDPLALNLWGKVVAPCIAKKIREGDESIIDINRGGLEWRHPYNKQVKDIGLKLIKGYIERKRNEIRKEKDTTLSEPVEKVLEKICKKLSELAKNELEESAPGKGEVESLMVLPLFANIEIDIPRNLSIYCPKHIVLNNNNSIVKIKSSNSKIKVLNSEIQLKTYKNDDRVLTNTFQVVGLAKNKHATITATLGSNSASCEVRVAEMKKKKNRKRTTGGGLFKEIVRGFEDEPIQRFQYLEGGKIKLFMNFPGVKEYLGEKLEYLSTPEGKTVLSEIIIEAFSRIISYKKMGKYFESDNPDALLGEMDRLRKEASLAIYDTIFHSNLDRLVNKD